MAMDMDMDVDVVDVDLPADDAVSTPDQITRAGQGGFLAEA